MIQILHKCTILQSNTQYNAIQWSQYAQSTQLTHQVSTQFTQLIRIGTVYTSDTPSVGTVYTVDTPSIGTGYTIDTPSINDSQMRHRVSVSQGGGCTNFTRGYTIETQVFEVQKVDTINQL